MRRSPEILLEAGSREGKGLITKGLGWLAMFLACTLAEGSPGDDFRQRVEALVAPKATKGIFAGVDGWLFLRSEIQGAAGLDFWPPPTPQAADEMTAPLDAGRSDALAAIDDMAAQLRRRALPFLLVLIPPKVQIYPERLFPDIDRAIDLGAGQRRFVDELARRGIAVLDLAPVFRAERQRRPEALYAAQDTHWTPYAARLAARHIAARLHAAGLLPGPGLRLAEETTQRDDCGDLWQKLKAPRPPCAQVTLYSLRLAGSDSLAPTVSRDSPILLLGDSSSVVYHEPHRSGLADHLARQVGQPVDLLGVTAGGANGAREALVRRGDGLAGKKFVVWVVSGRLLYEYPAWKKIELDAGRGIEP
jgi:hypothetical protein